MADVTSSGYTNATPCPWCKTPDSLEDVEDQLVVGTVIECTSCGGLYEITSVNLVQRLTTKGVDEDAGV